MVNGRLLRQETFDRLVDPGRSVPPRLDRGARHHDRDARGQPTIDDVLPLFARFAEDTVLVGHNVGFDLRLREGEGARRRPFSQPVLDTLLLDAALHPDHEEHSLEAIAARLGVEVVGRHTALGDALVTAEVFLRLMTLLQQQGIGTLGERRREPRARRCRPGWTASCTTPDGSRTATADPFARWRSALHRRHVGVSVHRMWRSPYRLTPSYDARWRVRDQHTRPRVPPPRRREAQYIAVQKSPEFQDLRQPLPPAGSSR